MASETTNISTRSGVLGENRQKNYNPENVPIGGKAKSATTRPVLGSINQNTVSGRIQPFRAAKQVF